MKIKTQLNKFAVWLYIKTKKDIPSSVSIIYGFKVMESKYLPKGEVLIGTGDIKELKGSILDEEIIKSCINKPCKIKPL